MFTHLEELLLSYIHTLPLELFAFVASFIEEVIAPIPSPTVMVMTGSFAALQDRALSALILIAIIAAVGKTIGALIVYFITDKMEDLIVTRFGRFFGVTHEEIERLGTKLGHGARDYLLLTFFRALPIMPSSVVSVGCGLLKVPLRLYIISTFLGTILRDSVYLYVGFVGTTALSSFVSKSSSIESIIQLLIVGAFAVLLGYLYIKRRNN